MTITRKLSPIIGFHGCDRAVAEKVLAGDCHLSISENSYDWLGSGIYFWVDSFARAYDWARSNKNNISQPYVIGAFLDPGLCLDLTDYGVAPQIKQAYERFLEFSQMAGADIPKNSMGQGGIALVRRLDCAVINFLNQALLENRGAPFDTVYGVFEEGEPLFPESALKEKTHIQIAVRDNRMIRGYFRPPELCDYSK